MVICDCKCHQDKNIKSNCGTCGNTGTKWDNPRDHLSEINPFETKPIFPKGSKTLI